MTTAYPAEFKRRAIALVNSGTSITAAAAELGMSKSCLHGWVTQDLIDGGRRDGVPSADRSALLAAWRRIHELETELTELKRARSDA
jgi:transposase